VDARTFTKNAEKVQTNAVCQKVDANCFMGQERSAGNEIHAKREVNNVKSV
jgi:hypothetical protein